MPYPAQIDAEAVVGRARDMIEAEGYEAVSLSRLAAAFGVKAPSLYRLFASKAELIRAVNEQTYRELVGAVNDPHPPVELADAGKPHPLAPSLTGEGEEANVGLMDASHPLPSSRPPPDLRLHASAPSRGSWRRRFWRGSADNPFDVRGRKP
ncbi:MAG: helix-turn-helix transcriptional regulator [Chloroflexi bacterium]|nr:helix-turn-helix transcriptional regulator [Chloroflexota bacterium]